MGTKRIDILFRKSNVDGSVSYISGGSAKEQIIRCADGYIWDSVSSTFKTSGATDITMTENPLQDGHFYHTATITTWDNGSYVFTATATKSGETPFSYTEFVIVTSGVASSPDGVSSASPDYCRCYIYFSDIPSTSPSVTVRYIAPAFATNTYIPTIGSGTYSSTTGLWYCDLLQTATAEIVCISRGIHKTFVVPAVGVVAVAAADDVR